MTPLAAYGLLAHGILCGALVSLLPLGHLRPRAALIGTSIALLAGLAPVLHAWFGPPSITLLLLALLHLPGKVRSPLGYPGALAVLLFAALFYPAALGGWGSFDPYAAGYQPHWLLLALGGLALFLWWRQAGLWLLILAGDLAIWLTGIFPNLWDVLLDPLLVLLCAAIVVRRHAARWFSARRR